MRKVLIALAAAGSALAVAAPASAQYYPAPPVPPHAYGQGYGYGYGQGYGHQHHYGQVRLFKNRVEQLRQRIHRLASVHRLSYREARRLDRHAVDLQQRIHYAAARGLHPREQYEIERRIEGLRHAIRYEARDGNRWGWNGYDRNDNAYGYYSARREGRGSDGRWDDDDDDDRRYDDRGRRGRDRDDERWDRD